MAEPTEVNPSEKVGLINYIFPIVILAFFVGGYFLFVTPPKTGEAVVPVNKSIGKTVMYFYSEACHYCQQQKPIVEKMESEGYNITWMDVGVHPEYWQEYGIQGTPTFLASNGEMKVGFTQEDELRKWLEQHGAKSI